MKSTASFFKSKKKKNASSTLQSEIDSDKGLSASGSGSQKGESDMSEANSLVTMPSGNMTDPSSATKKAKKKFASNQDASSAERAAIAAEYQAIIDEEKAGKRKLFHSLVKLANELKRVRQEAGPLRQQAAYLSQAWYQGGLWRAPRVLPGVANEQERSSPTKVLNQRAVSLSDLFFNLVVVTAFTRVGVAITNEGAVTSSSLAYFAIFWTIWTKEAGYSTRFETTDLSSTAESLVTCFAVLFASLSVSHPLTSPESSRVMMAAGFCSFLHLLLYARVWWWFSKPSKPLEVHVLRYARFNVFMNALESTTWATGIWGLPESSVLRPYLFLAGILLALRIPRAFMANDFHAACSKRGVLYILLLGFMLQSVVVVATGFFEDQSPSIEQYGFIGASCLLLFCIKLLYVDDSSTPAGDHALLVSRAASVCFNLGQFALLLSTTTMGSGLTLLTADYLAAAAALPDNAKNLVCGGFSAVLLSTAFIKSMHLKRVPVGRRDRSLFIAAYAIQSFTTLLVVGATAAMCFGRAGYLQLLMHNGVQLLWGLSSMALLLVVLSWLDEGLELALIGDGERKEYLVHPFGFWWCLKPEVSMEELSNDKVGTMSNPRLSSLSPLLGESVANLKYMGEESSSEEKKEGSAYGSLNV